MTGELHPIFNADALGASHRLHAHTHGDGTKIVAYYNKHLRLGRFTEQTYKSWHAEVDAKASSILNGSGSLLAFYGDHIIEVVDREGKKITLTVNGGIKQVLWHPLAYLDSCLVVLTGQETIEIYELNEPRYEKPTLVLNEPTSQLGISSRVIDITNIAFAPDGLSLYLFSTSEGGDVHVICPLLPSRIKADRAKWARQWNKATALYSTLTKDTPDDAKVATIEYLEFVTQLLQAIEKNGSDGELVIPEHRRRTISQGPYNIHGFPEKLYSAVGTKLTVVPLGESEAHLLLLSFDDSTNILLFPSTEVLMSWTKDLKNAYTLMLVEEFTATGTAFATCDGVAVLGIDSAQRVEIPYLQALEDCIRDCNLAALQDINFTSSICKIPGKFHSVARFNAPGNKGIILVGDHHAKIVPSTEAAKSDTETELDSQPGKEPTYTVCFPNSLEEILNTNKELQRRKHQPLPLVPPALKNIPLNSDLNEQHLATLTNISKEVMDRIILSQSAGLLMHNRLSLQQYELHRQVETVADICSRHSVLRDSSEAMSSRLTSVLKRDRRLKQRLCMLQSTLNRINSSHKFSDLPLSKKEADWFRELKNQAISFNDYVLQSAQLRDELAFLKNELESLPEHRQHDRQEEEPFDFRRLQELLKLDSKIITECTDNLSAAARELERKLCI
ncbi:AEL168Cp [Eremothecium gossypii ATCC 10895]|uniref:AEL168Cp n=1 Tax=Eremothecium gossypii (strain ATCC 10895 / CBS 109.51 / FGSC 9923 / NRRL Y-1056) TaxID=284811 RepID=Q758C0_EREGS|nr:AEL168Cp [Eremothecium gossypii ATCC 10895]AAS52517.2 AEL168Cp [Eremothecium gossypii ATCC 10895]